MNYFKVPQVIDPISKINVAKSSYKYAIIIEKFKEINEILNSCKEDEIEQKFYELFFLETNLF